MGRKQWPKAANEARIDSILRTGDVLVQIKYVMEELLPRLNEAVARNNIKLAKSIEGDLVGRLMLMQAYTEDIQQMLENVPTGKEL